MLDESELDGVRDQIRHPQPLQDPDGDNNFDQDVANDLLRRVHELEKMLTECDSYDKALALRAMLGTSDKRSQLTIDIQKAFDPQKPSSTWMITPEQHRELGRIWQSVHRKCAKLEKELAPSAEDVSHASGDFAGANREEHDHDPADDFDR